MKKLQFSLITLLILGLLNNNLSFSFDYDLSNSFSFSYLINQINTQLVRGKNRSVGKRNLINDYCQTMLDPNNSNQIGSRYRNYDAKQSVFLYLLCNNQWLKYQESFADFLWESEEQYLKHSNFIKLWYEDYCPEKYQETCNIPLITKKILNDILEELFILQQARSIGLTLVATDNKEIQQKIDDLAYESFMIQGFCSDKTHNYPKTCNIWEGHIKWYYTSLKQLRIFKIDSLLKQAQIREKGEVLRTCDLEKYPDEYNIILCWTVGETESWLKPFINVIYNEVLRYQLFLSYYNQYISDREPNNITSLEQQELIEIPKNLNVMYETIHQSIRDLLDFHNSYIVHIGLLSHQEDLLRMRDKWLSKLITPFYNIYEKVRNVQIQDK